MRLLIVVTLAALVAACSPKQIGFNRMVDALKSTASSYSTDNDLEFVRLAAPTTLKMIEMVLAQQPTNEGLLVTACSGFTQYAYAFLQLDADAAEGSNQAAAADLRVRAALMQRRARDYCVRALDVRHKGFRDRLNRDAKAAVADMTAADVPALYWLAVSWGSELSVVSNQLLRLPELVTVRVILDRALALDERWERGAIHEAFIALDGLPGLLGGSADRARQHFDRAIELSGGQSAFAYVTMASSIAAPARDRAAFDKWIKATLAVDVDKVPEMRLANLIAQKRARVLMGKTSTLFPGR